MEFLKKYKHTLIIPIYGILYMLAFRYVEQRNVPINIIHMKMDDYIPFCEYFILPYLLWFLMWTHRRVLTLFNDNRTEFYQFAVCMGIGMTLFLMISYVFPNGQNLRPYTFARHNICTELVQHLYKIDTPRM